MDREGRKTKQPCVRRNECLATRLGDLDDGRHPMASDSNDHAATLYGAAGAGEAGGGPGLVAGGGAALAVTERRLISSDSCIWI